MLSIAAADEPTAAATQWFTELKAARVTPEQVLPLPANTRQLFSNQRNPALFVRDSYKTLATHIAGREDTLLTGTPGKVGPLGAWRFSGGGLKQANQGNWTGHLTNHTIAWNVS
jgi:hypothetical protein